jgi:hypothetical protein
MARDPITFTGKRTVAGPLSRVAPVMDPQSWQDNVPLLWKSSRLIQGDRRGLPPNRQADPKVRPRQLTWQNQLLFEDISLPPITRHRNVLDTSFASTSSQIKFTYSQYECLESTFLFQDSDGGIDVDEGGALAVARAGQVDLTISKKIRFTQPEDKVALVNLFGEVMVKLVMEMLLLGI